MKDNLKNCPFCDGEGKLETMLYGGTAVSCQNTDCGFYGYNVETSMWNTRPNDAKWMIAEGLKLLKPSDYVEVLTYLASPMGIRLTDAEEIIKALGRVCELNSNPPKQSSEGE